MLRKNLYRYGIFVLLLLITTACTAVAISPSRMPSALHPQGPGAARLAELWWVMLAFATLTFVIVVGLLFSALLRRRRGTPTTEPDSHGGDTGRNWVIWGGIVLPLVVIGIVFSYSIYTLAVVDDQTAESAFKIEVFGRRWWWEVRYLDHGFSTANEIHIPVGVPVEIQLQSADVIHSFWVPELHGKMDLIPTRINKITIQADHPGIYRGECAEFCGLQHAHMNFMVVAESEADFNAWVSTQKQPAVELTTQAAVQGQQVFLSAGCVYCHTVRGLDDKSIDRSAVDLGPDLTHLYSRLTIASGSLTQNRGNLAGWISDSQHIKPGNQMPNIYLNSEDLQNLLAYLESLR
jgi:cytochrome c oxidase subunit II